MTPYLPGMVDAHATMNYSSLGLPPTTGDGVSPVTISPEWSRTGRLLMMSGLSILGSVGNVYMISAIIVEDHLSKRGNTYIANVALVDLLISGIVILATAVVLLAGAEDCPPVCNVQWFLGLLCGMVTIFSMTAIAIENYTRLCLPPEYHAKITTSRITASVLLIWGVSAALVALIFVFKLGPDYCNRKINHGKPIHLWIASLFFLSLLAFTAILYTKIILRIRVARANPGFKPPLAFKWDYSLMLTNLYSFIMFIIFWAPFVFFLLIPSLEKLGKKPFYWSAWFALSKSCFNNLLYCFSNRHFCDAYVKLFHYCCCKTTVSFSRRPRADGSRPMGGDVRVHIIPGYNVYPYTSPQRSGSSAGETAKKVVPAKRYTRPHFGRARSKDREIYQL